MKLPTLNRESGLFILIFLLIGAYIGVKLFTPKVINETKITVKQTSDTTINKVDTTFQQKSTAKKPIQPKKTEPKTEKSPEPEKYDSTRTYSGTYHFDYGKFDWNIRTGGILDSYEFKPTFELPTITNTKEKTIMQTRTIIQKGVFIGGGVDSQRDFHVGAAYLGKNFLIDYNFTPARGFNGPLNPVQVHQISFKYKVF